jgi:dTMP kinase
MKKLFIVFEGIDGAGTSTQACLLRDYFIRINNKAIISPEPSEGPIGKLIREAMQHEVIFIKDRHKFDEQMAYLFAADRHYHLYNDIDGVFKLTQQDNCHVISTRYYFSSLAYNCNTQAEFEFVSCLNQKFPNPDLAVYIDIPIEISISRLSERASLEIYETEDKLKGVRQNYYHVFQDYKGHLLKLDGTQSKETIHQQITDYIENTFRESLMV